MKFVFFASLLITPFAVSAGGSVNGSRAVSTAAADHDWEAQQLCRLAMMGGGQTIYYRTGEVFTYRAEKGATFNHRNGRVITYRAGELGETWYHSTGRVLTYRAGEVGATWYYASGQVITYRAGEPGSTWYHSNGRVMTYDGPAMSAEQLAYPCDYLQ